MLGRPINHACSIKTVNLDCYTTKSELQTSASGESSPQPCNSILLSLQYINLCLKFWWKPIILISSTLFINFLSHNIGKVDNDIRKPTSMYCCNDDEIFERLTKVHCRDLWRNILLLCLFFFIIIFILWTFLLKLFICKTY